jgi:hypothetical protein
MKISFTIHVDDGVPEAVHKAVSDEISAQIQLACHGVPGVENRRVEWMRDEYDERKQSVGA